MMNTGSIATRWSLVNDLVIPAVRALTEVTWLYAWVALVQTQNPGSAQLGLGEAFVLIAVNAWCVRVTQVLPWAFPWNRLPLIPATVLALAVWLHLSLAPHSGWQPGAWIDAITAPGATDAQVSGETLFGFWVLALYLSSRGLLIGLYAPTVELLLRWFIGGMAAFLFLFAALALAPNPLSDPLRPGPLGLLIISYVVVSMSLVALVHAQSLVAEIGRKNALSLSWMVAILVPMALIAGFAVLLADSRWIIRAIMQTAVAIALLMWWGLGWFAYWLFQFLIWLSSLFPGGSPGTPRPGGPIRRPPPPRSSPDIDWGAPNISVDITVIAAIAILAALIAAIVYLIFKRPPREAADNFAEEERISLWSWSLVWNQLRNLLQALFGRIETKLHTVAHAKSSSGSPPIEQPLNIRVLYRRVLDWAASMGSGRPPSATPLEFSQRLSSVVPQSTPSVEMITSCYNDARYGEIDVGDLVLDEIKNAVDDLVRIKGDDDVDLTKRRTKR